MTHHAIDCKANGAWTHLSVTDGEAMVGLVDVVWGKDDEATGAYVQGLFVNPDYRRKGHARELLRRALDRCRARGYRAAYLLVKKDNAAAVALYESAGFFPMTFDAASGQYTYVIDLRGRGTGA